MALEGEPEHKMAVIPLETKKMEKGKRRPPKSFHFFQLFVQFG